MTVCYKPNSTDIEKLSDRQMRKIILKKQQQKLKIFVGTFFITRPADYYGTLEWLFVVVIFVVV